MILSLQYFEALEGVDGIDHARQIQVQLIQGGRDDLILQDENGVLAIKNNLGIVAVLDTSTAYPIRFAAEGYGLARTNDGTSRQTNDGTPSPPRNRGDQQGDERESKLTQLPCTVLADPHPRSIPPSCPHCEAAP